MLARFKTYRSPLVIAVLALAVPIIIHLFNFRRFKTVYFSNVSFLREIKEETASRSRVKHLLVLACRMLAIAFLVFAFAQPFIPKRNTNISAGKKYVSIYVDNSFSMGAMSGGVRLLDKAKQAGKEIVQNYAANDQFQLLTNDLRTRPLSAGVLLVVWSVIRLDLQCHRRI